jgi:hypothetical protein
MGSLDELLEYIIEAPQKAFEQLKQSLHQLNDVIVKNEHEISPDNLKTYQTSLTLKQSELDALDQEPIAVVEKPVDDPNDAKTQAAIAEIATKTAEREQLRAELDQAKRKRMGLTNEQRR